MSNGLPEPTPPTETQEEGKLLPCPFCLSNRVGFIYIRDGQQLGCKSCSAAVHAFNPNAAEKCIEKWNHRPHKLNPVAAPTERVETSPEPDQLMRFINHLCGGSAQGFIAFAKWRNGQEKLARHIAAVAPSPAGESQHVHTYECIDASGKCRITGEV